MNPYTKIKIKLFLFDFIFNLIIFLAIGVIAYFKNKILETIFFYICWLGLRYVFPKIFHYRQSKTPMGNLLGCMFWSIVIFDIAIENVLPLSISLFSSVIISFGINYILYIIQEYIDFKTKSERTIMELTKDELLGYMENSLLSAEEKDAIQYYVIDKMKGERFYNAMGYSKRQSLRIYKSVVSKINNLIRQ